MRTGRTPDAARLTDPQTFHGVQPFDEFNPCTGDELIGTESSNVVNHVTFTGSIRATGSDGSVVTFHEVMHETLTPGGTVTVSFDRPTMTCTP
jgi:hypothetical protein